MKASFIILFLLKSIYSQTQILMPESNAVYTAPAGWVAGEKIVTGQGEYLIAPTSGSKTVFITVRQFDDSLSMDKYMYKDLFKWVSLAARNDPGIAPNIPAIMDTAIGSVHFVGLEVSGTKEVMVEYVKTNGVDLLALWYRVSVADWQVNRDEYYKNFQNINFINTNTMLVKRQADSGFKKDDGSQLFFNLLGKKISFHEKAIQFKIAR